MFVYNLFYGVKFRKNIFKNYGERVIMEFLMIRVNVLIKKEIKDLSKNMNIVMMCVFLIIFCIIYLKLFEGNILNVEIDKV